VIEEGAALGIAYDGDGDRVAFVDEYGQPVANDRMLALFARRLLGRKQGAVVYDTKCSLVVAEEVAGHTFVEAKFLESGALLAGELSGLELLAQHSKQPVNHHRCLAPVGVCLGGEQVSGHAMDYTRLDGLFHSRDSPTADSRFVAEEVQLGAIYSRSLSA
jgi:hypothetical protein